MDTGCIVVAGRNTVEVRSSWVVAEEEDSRLLAVLEHIRRLVLRLEAADIPELVERMRLTCLDKFEAEEGWRGLR